MNQAISIHLDERLTTFVDEQVALGHYADAGAVMRAGLLLLAEDQAKLANLRTAIDEGDRSGVSALSVMDIWAAAEREFELRAGD